jgi:hypothetical protein
LQNGSAQRCFVEQDVEFASVLRHVGEVHYRGYRVCLGDLQALNIKSLLLLGLHGYTDQSQKDRGVARP